MNTSMRLPDAVRISSRGREILIKLKRYTGIGQWNTLCRMAYCYSLALSTEPAQLHEKGDIALEIDWATFTGPLSTELAALTTYRLGKSGFAPGDVTRFVRAHLERGLGSLQNVRSIAELASLTISGVAARKLVQDPDET